MEVIKANIVIFVGYVNFIGGVEQWYYTIAKKYGVKNDITLVYKKCARNQLQRMRKLTRCIEYVGQEIECRKIIFCYDLSIVDKVKAEEYILTAHADYKIQHIHLTIPPQITSVYAVSEIARVAFQEVHKDQLDKLGLECKLLYNPIMLDEPKRVLKLVSATRLTPEKGGKRMQMLAERLNSRGIPFVWLVFTTEKCAKEIEGFIYMQPRLDILGYIKDADYLVQLSDTEGFSYSINEALGLGTPLLTTDFPVAGEMGLEHGKNGFIFKMDMSNMDEVIDLMYEKNLKGFKHEFKNSDEEWNKIMDGKVKNKYVYKEEKGIEVEVIKPCHYTEEEKDCVQGDFLLVKSKERAKMLVEKGYVKYV